MQEDAHAQDRPHRRPRQGPQKKRKTTYDIRDGKLRGFGIRVLPSGAKRYFIHSQHRGRRV